MSAVYNVQCDAVVFESQPPFYQAFNICWLDKGDSISYLCAVTFFKLQFNQA